MVFLFFISVDYHRVAEAEKSVSFAYSFVVCAKHFFSACKSGNQHKKCAFGKMKVGYEGVNYLEFIQYFTLLGSFDIEDYIINMIGIFMGFLLYKLDKKLTA